MPKTRAKFLPTTKASESQFRKNPTDSTVSHEKTETNRNTADVIKQAETNRNDLANKGVNQRHLQLNLWILSFLKVF